MTEWEWMQGDSRHGTLVRLSEAEAELAEEVARNERLLMTQDRLNKEYEAKLKAAQDSWDSRLDAQCESCINQLKVRIAELEADVKRLLGNRP